MCGLETANHNHSMRAFEFLTYLSKPTFWADHCTYQYGTSEDETMHEDGTVAFKEEMFRNISRCGSPIWTE